jgi:hypothetical protein
MNKTFNLGDIVRDPLTGYEGTVIGRTMWLWGCVTIGVLSKELHDGLPIESQWFDEDRLEDVEPTLKEAAPKTGGPERKVSAPLR